jgi:hypothetical protein
MLTRTIRLFLLLEGATFVIASIIHGGALVDGYAHRQARIAESIIAVVLLGGLALTWIVPRRTRSIGLVAQTLALVGTLMGVTAIALGVGPRTVPDIVYHVGIIIVLVWGLVVARRAKSEVTG